MGIDIITKLKEEKSYKYIKELENNRTLYDIIPDMEPMKEVGECKYHVINCLDHSIFALKILEQLLENKEFLSTHLRNNVDNYLNKEIEVGIKRVELLKLGILLHDIGKPPAKTVDPDGRVRFTNHENVGADMVVDILTKLKLNKKSITLVHTYVKYHMILLMFYKNNDMSKNDLFNIFNELNDDVIGIFLLGYADIVSTRKLLNPKEDMGIIKTFMEYGLTNYIYKYV